MPIVNDYTALLSGSTWNGIEVTGKQVFVTFSFPTAIPSYDLTSGGAPTVDGFTAATVQSFQGFTEAQKTQARAALAEWAAASGIIFLEAAPGKGDINFGAVDFSTSNGGLNSGAAGIGFHPFGNWNYSTYPNFVTDLDVSGDIFMNTQFISSGTFNYGTLLHEIGHALGFKHPTEVFTNFAAQPAVTHDQVLSSDDPARTIMATTGDGNAVNVHLQQLDKDAAAAIYGAAGSGGTQDTSWNWDPNTQTLEQHAGPNTHTIIGTSVNDLIYGTATGGDRIFGLAGNNNIHAEGSSGGTGNFVAVGDGNNFIYGSDLYDTFVVGAGSNTVYGGLGGNLVDYSFVPTAINADLGTGYVYKANNAVDRLYRITDLTDFSSANNRIYDDPTVHNVITLGSGNNVVYSGGGYDYIYAGDGNNTVIVYGTDGSYVSAGAGNNFVVSGGGSDTIFLGGGSNIVYAGGGNDYVVVGDGNNRLYGGADNSFFVVGGGNNTIYGEGGSDTVDYANVTGGVFVDLAGRYAYKTTGGTSWRNGAAGVTITATDNLIAISNVGGTAFSDRLYGTSGGNTFRPGQGNDVIYGQGGSDTVQYFDQTGGVFVDLAAGYALKTTGGASWRNGAAGVSVAWTDALISITSAVGSNFNDRLYDAAAGGSTLDGQAGNDVLYGAHGNDFLFGGDGNDVLVTGGPGGDTMYGEAGSDQFVFSRNGGASNYIGDFQSGVDSIGLSNAAFGTYTTGQTVSLHTGTGTNAGQIYGNSGQGFAYSTDTGTLWFNANWATPGTAVQIATFNGNPTLTATDFTVL